MSSAETATAPRPVRHEELASLWDKNVATSVPVPRGQEIFPGVPNLTAVHLASLSKEQLNQLQAARNVFLEEHMNAMTDGKPVPPSKEIQAILQQQANAVAALSAKQAQEAQRRALACRVYVGSIAYEILEPEIRAVFEPIAPVRSIDMTHDPVTGHHKGFCFIEFATPEGAVAAIENMNGFMLGGRALKVNRPNNFYNAEGVAPPASNNADSGANAQQQQQQQQQQQGNRRARIYVGSIVYDITEEDLKSVFEPFGKIFSCDLVQNPETGRHRGYGFIEFFEEEAALAAIEHMNGFELGGRQLRVNFSQQSLASGASLPSSMAASLNAAAPPAAATGSNAVSLAGAQAAAAAIAPGGPAKDPQAALSREENMTISSSQRLSIMQKLSRDSDPAMSRCIVLRNMVSASDADDELEGEVREECSRYGGVEKVIVHVTGDNVAIYVLFTQAQHAQMARQALHGRFFAGRTVQAESYDEKAMLEGQLV